MLISVFRESKCFIFVCASFACFLFLFIFHIHTVIACAFRVLYIIFFSSLLSLYFVEPSPLYDNNHYHEECLRCNSCGINLSGQNHKRARRFKNQILCDLHFADVALMECSDFMQQLRSFKPQSLGCAVARRKSSTTLIFPLPPQACSGNNRKSLRIISTYLVYVCVCVWFFAMQYSVV